MSHRGVMVVSLPVVRVMRGFDCPYRRLSAGRKEGRALLLTRRKGLSSLRGGGGALDLVPPLDFAVFGVLRVEHRRGPSCWHGAGVWLIRSPHHHKESPSWFIAQFTTIKSFLSWGFGEQRDVRLGFLCVFEVILVDFP